MPEPGAPRLRPPEQPTAAPLADPALKGKSRKDPAGDQVLRYEIGHVVPGGARPRATAGEDLEQMMDRGAWNVDTVAAAMSDADMSVLRPGVRSRLVAYIGGGYLVGGGDEETIVRLLSTASPTAAAAILADLRRDHAAIQGKVGRRRPDIADFWLDAHRPFVLSDVTANVNRLFRNFKTRFYAEVLSRLTGEGLADRME